MAPKLRIDPCPFCGAAVEVKPAAPHPSGEEFYISCWARGTGLTHDAQVRGKTELDTVKKWNRKK